MQNVWRHRPDMPRSRPVLEMNEPDIPIWADPDVRRIYDVTGGQPNPRFWDFNNSPEALALMRDFTAADQAAGSDAPPDAFIAACLTGIRAVEHLPRTVDSGWRKFLIYMIDMNNHFLWDLHHRREEVAAIAEWTVETIENFGWGPDGNTTAIGQRHSNAIGLAAASGGGVLFDESIQAFGHRNGDLARLAAEAGHFSHP
jgi:hypothetical protein